MRAGLGRQGLKGLVSVNDENGTPVAEALVLATWTQPDGSEHSQYASRGSRGVAAFSTNGPAGRYTLTIVNIQRSQYTFDPVHSVLSKSITIERQAALAGHPRTGR